MSCIFFILHQSAPHIVEASACPPYVSLIVSPRMPFHFLMVTRYIAIDIILYSYTLPINHFLHPYLSLCLSCNLSLTTSTYGTDYIFWRMYLRRLFYLKGKNVLSLILEESTSFSWFLGQELQCNYWTYY